MTTLAIISLAFIYTLIALRLQATQVMQPNFLESCGMVLWPIMLLVGVAIGARVKVLAWMEDRRQKKITNIARRK